MFKVASWNLNSVRSRLSLVTTWLKAREPDVLLLQELKGTEFPSEVFKELGYESIAVTQKAYNGVATLSRHPMETISKTLVGDEADSHARFLEVIINGIRIVNVYLPNGNPVGSDKFAYKLTWMDRLHQQMIKWLQDDIPTLVGGDFNVIPEDIDCHKPSSWEHDALFQPEPRARYRAILGLSYIDAYRSLHVGEVGQFTFWDYFRKAFENNRGIRIDHFLCRTIPIISMKSYLFRALFPESRELSRSGFAQGFRPRNTSRKAFQPRFITSEPWQSKEFTR
jgi:exodeoxyribonuclease-3